MEYKTTREYKPHTFKDKILNIVWISSTMACATGEVHREQKCVQE